MSAYSGRKDAAARGRAQQVAGGVSGWIENTFYDNEDDEPVEILTPGWVVYGKRRHAELPEDDVPPQLYPW